MMFYPISNSWKLISQLSFCLLLFLLSFSVFSFPFLYSCTLIENLFLFLSNSFFLLFFGNILPFYTSFCISFSFPHSFQVAHCFFLVPHTNSYLAIYFRHFCACLQIMRSCSVLTF